MTLDDLDRLLQTKHATRNIRLEVDPQSQRQKCSPWILLSTLNVWTQNGRSITQFPCDSTALLYFNLDVFYTYALNSRVEPRVLVCANERQQHKTFKNTHKASTFTLRSCCPHTGCRPPSFCYNFTTIVELRNA